MPKTYSRDLIILLVGKLFLLGGLFWFCFSPQNRPHITTAEMTTQIMPKKVSHD